MSSEGSGASVLMHVNYISVSSVLVLLDLELDGT